jgi:phospholipid/cholesterol/gamma-HCH transport system permease protein
MNGAGGVVIRRAIEVLGGRGLDVIAEMGRIAVFGGRILVTLVRPPVRFRRIVMEIYDCGVLSLAIVCTSGIAVGMVLALQGYNTLARFGAAENLGAVVGLSLIRELGPVLTGLLVTGRAGSAMAAEIGMMVATEQIDGIRTLAVDPLHFVVVPKAIAMSLVMPLLSCLFIVLVMPLLSCLFIVFAIFGGWLVGVELLGLDGGVYLSSLEYSVDFREDVQVSLLKALVFGMLIALIATHRGFASARSAAGVSAATTSTVVRASVCIVIADYAITALWGI